MRPLFLVSVPALAAAAFLAAPRPAQAQIHIGADGGVAIGTQSGVGAGPTFDGRLGYRLGMVPVIWIQPEIGGGFTHFGDADASLGRVFGGARVGIKGLIQPNAYAHLGAVFGDAKGFSGDIGGALDLKISLVNVGAHIGFVGASNDTGSLNWIDLGAHAGLTF